MKKRNYIILAIVLILAILSPFVFRSLGGPRLNKPESVIYDPTGDRFLISNVGSKSIMAMSPDGKFSKFMDKGFTAPKGMIYRDGMLFVADQKQIHIIDVNEASIIESIPIEGAVSLNDIAIGEGGQIYVTDMGGDAVYIYDKGSKAQEKIISPLLKSPNGIIYDRPRRQMFVVCFTKHSPILSLNVVDKSVTIFKDTIYSDLDGIAIDDPGRIFFSSWQDDTIIEIPQEQNRFIATRTGYKDAADMYYHLPTNELIVPLFSSNRIVRIDLDK